MINMNPVSSQFDLNELYSTRKANQAQQTTPAGSADVAAQEKVQEKKESRLPETRETSAQSATEALRTLANREPPQWQVTSQEKTVVPKSATGIYQAFTQ